MILAGQGYIPHSLLRLPVFCYITWKQCTHNFSRFSLHLFQEYSESKKVVKCKHGNCICGAWFQPPGLLLIWEYYWREDFCTRFIKFLVVSPSIPQIQACLKFWDAYISEVKKYLCFLFIIDKKNILEWDNMSSAKVSNVTQECLTYICIIDIFQLH